MTLLSLRILRAVDLVETERDVVSGHSSNPFCVVYANKKKIGWTPTQFRTSDPLWGGPNATFRFRYDDSGGDSCKNGEVTIQLFGFESFRSDTPLGEVKLHLSELLDWVDRDTYPNVWLPIGPKDGCKCSGKLQVRLVPVSDESMHFALPVLQKRLSAVHFLSLGPKLKGASKTALPYMVSTATAPVILHVYDVSRNEMISRLNKVSKAAGAGGIFHAGVEIYGKEYTFGGSTRECTGICSCAPRRCPMHKYSESIYLGDCELTMFQVKSILKMMQPKWMATTYDLLRKNCCLFSKEFAIELGVGSIPKWVYSLADVGAMLDDYLQILEIVTDEEKGQEECTEGNPSCVDETENMPSRVQRAFRRSIQRSVGGVEVNSFGVIEDHTSEHVKDARVQRLFSRCVTSSSGNVDDVFGTSEGITTEHVKRAVCSAVLESFAGVEVDALGTIQDRTVDHVMAARVQRAFRRSTVASFMGRDADADAILRTKVHRGDNVSSTPVQKAITRPKGNGIGVSEEFVGHNEKRTENVRIAALAQRVTRSSTHMSFGGLEVDSFGTVSDTTLEHAMAARVQRKYRQHSLRIRSVATEV